MTDSPCVDCRVNTHHRDGIGESFMLNQWVWDSIQFQDSADYLCIKCVEKRLGRRLTPPDFILCPLNTYLLYYRSKLLISRMTRFDND